MSCMDHSYHCLNSPPSFRVQTDNQNSNTNNTWVGGLTTIDDLFLFALFYSRPFLKNKNSKLFHSGFPKCIYRGGAKVKAFTGSFLAIFGTFSTFFHIFFTFFTFFHIFFTFFSHFFQVASDMKNSDTKWGG